MGFKDGVTKEEFRQKVSEVIQKLYEKVGSDYEIQDNTSMLYEG